MPTLDELREALERARTFGFLGPGPVESHIHHAQGFATAAVSALGREPRSFCDLGTGGGVPGLVLAVTWRSSRGIFIEVGQRRSAWLRDVIETLGLDDRIRVLEERAEVAGRPDDLREHVEVVTARSFAAPAVTAEIAAGLVEVGGLLVVSEPPDVVPEERWPALKLGDLGFDAAERVQVAEAHFVVVRKARPAPEKYPRGVGRPAKRPLW